MRRGNSGAYRRGSMKRSWKAVIAGLALCASLSGAAFARDNDRRDNGYYQTRGDHDRDDGYYNNGYYGRGDRDGYYNNRYNGYRDDRDRDDGYRGNHYRNHRDRDDRRDHDRR